MHIGYIYDLHVYPPRGGNHRHVLELVEGFLGAGHTVSVVDDPTLPGVKDNGSSPAELRDFINAIDLLYVRIDSRFTHQWCVLGKCLEFLDQQPVVWEINSPANENLAFSWLGGRIATSDRKEGHLRTLRRWLHALRQYPGIWREERHRRKLSGKVSAAICVSEAVGQYAREELNIGDVCVLPNGGVLVEEAEIEQRRNRRKRHEFTVLYSGSAIYPWQGLDYLYQVIKLARKAAPEIRFVLAVNQKTPDLTRFENVEIHEGLDQEAVRDAICSADVCVALIPEWPWSKYGFHGSPTKLFEYMAFMVPVITSSHGQMKDIITDGVDGLLTDNKPEMILEKLIYLKNNPEQARMIGRNAWLKINSEFNWRHNVEKTLAVFDRVLK